MRLRSCWGSDSRGPDPYVGPSLRGTSASGGLSTSRFIDRAAEAWRASYVTNPASSGPRRTADAIWIASSDRRSAPPVAAATRARSASSSTNASRAKIAWGSTVGFARATAFVTSTTATRLVASCRPLTRARTAPDSGSSMTSLVIADESRYRLLSGGRSGARPAAHRSPTCPGSPVPAQGAAWSQAAAAGSACPPR